MVPDTRLDVIPCRVRLTQLPVQTFAHRQAIAPAGGAGAIRGSLGSTALVAVVELRREPAGDSACELGRGIGPGRATHELVP
jgi:hypothetical protein